MPTKEQIRQAHVDLALLGNHCRKLVRLVNADQWKAINAATTELGKFLNELQASEPCKVFVLAGESHELRTLENLDEREFKTREEQNAFLEGIALAEGYMSVSTYDTKEEAEAELAAEQAESVITYDCDSPVDTHCSRCGKELNNVSPGFGIKNGKAVCRPCLTAAGEMPDMLARETKNASLWSRNLDLGEERVRYVMVESAMIEDGSGAGDGFYGLVDDECYTLPQFVEFLQRELLSAELWSPETGDAIADRDEELHVVLRLRIAKHELEVRDADHT